MVARCMLGLLLATAACSPVLHSILLPIAAAQAPPLTGPLPGKLPGHPATGGYHGALSPRLQVPFPEEFLPPVDTQPPALKSLPPLPLAAPDLPPSAPSSGGSMTLRSAEGPSGSPPASHGAIGSSGAPQDAASAPTLDVTGGGPLAMAPPEVTVQLATSQVIALLSLQSTWRVPDWPAPNSLTPQELRECWRWPGVTCSLRGMVLGLQLPSRNLRGSIPRAIATLGSVETLDLSGNSLSGNLYVLPSLTALTSLNLNHNNLEGELPETLCHLARLQSLSLNHNRLYGVMSACFFGMPALLNLSVVNNFLFSFLSATTVFKKPSLDVDLRYNYFSGPLPCTFTTSTGSCPNKRPPRTPQSTRDSFNPAPLHGAPYAGDPNLTSAASNSSLQESKLYDPAPVVFASPPMQEEGDGFPRGIAHNCLSLVPHSCGAVQRPYMQCKEFCGTLVVGVPEREAGKNRNMTAMQAPCGGFGKCLPGWAVPQSQNVERSSFVCVCSAGFKVSQAPEYSWCIKGAPPARQDESRAPLSVGAIIGIAIGACVGTALLLLTIWYFLLRPRLRRWSDLDLCTEYTLPQMEVATAGWAVENILGEGGYAVVYKGTSPKGQLWAVKRAKVMTNDFETEVRALATLNHRNLVRLLGYCLHMDVSAGKQEQILVYEFVPHGDLSQLTRSGSFSFEQMLHIALGIAEGLVYLHGFPQPIIHRDIKPNNILLDEKMQAKIADFSLLKQLESDSNEAQTRIAGTPGYVDPSYRRTGILTPRSDVYCYGIVLLELLSGHSPLVGEEREHITHWAARMVEAYDFRKLYRPCLEASEEQFIAFCDLALDCVKIPGTRRPEMRDVVRRLSVMLDDFRAPEDGGQKEEVGEGGREAQSLAPEVMVDHLKSINYD